MNDIFRSLFKAIHEGRWLKIEYRNQKNETTNYWIAVRSMDPVRGTLDVDGLHLSLHQITRLNPIYLRSILSAEVVEGTYCPVNEELVNDIALNPEKYRLYFSHSVNLKILDYLEDANRLDFSPYYREFDLVRYIDDRNVAGHSVYPLSDEQFGRIVNYFQFQTQDKQNRKKEGRRRRAHQLGLNILSLDTEKGLYVLAYRKLHFDVKNHLFRPEEEITVCREFTLNGETVSARRFLDAEDYELLENFEEAQEVIKDRIQAANPAVRISDVPYIIGIEGDVPVDLHEEYNGVIRMMEQEDPPVPLRAFFGDLTIRPEKSKGSYTLALINDRPNLDQLLAVRNAMKYPVSYVQGPPGTGKTSTIIDTLVTAFFNERTVLFASYNNTPIDGVFEKLTKLTYRDRRIPFPVLRLGNQEKVKEAIRYIRSLKDETKNISVFQDTLKKRKAGRAQRAAAFDRLMDKYDELLDLQERKESLLKLIEHEKNNAFSLQMVNFENDIENRQLKRIEEEIQKRGVITEEDALSLLDTHKDELLQFLYFTSARYIQRLGTEEFLELNKILDISDESQCIEEFNRFLTVSQNVRLLQKVFPVMITTCISSHRLGDPETLFDMTILDEASQCNTAVSLLPVLRGAALMLVGDPQQLNPVVLLDPATNDILKKRYSIGDEYDYRKSSIYKTFLACDCVSDEVLLHSHYRCHKKIIDFNNKKYYSGKLKICSDSVNPQPLIFRNLHGTSSEQRNTSPKEAEEIAAFCAANRDKSIGIITPFVNQRALIEEELKNAGIQDVPVGTVHAFQGDEKDIILFSAAITGKTGQRTYDWLKNNKELINVATSRAKEQLIFLADSDNIRRLHVPEEDDDLYELMCYMETNGQTSVSPRVNDSRALGVKPFSTKTEEAFLISLNHALENIWLTQNRYSVKKEVPVSQVFENDLNNIDLFYTGRFDFVIYHQESGREYPMLAIELDGKEHEEDRIVAERDRKKQIICDAHHLQLIRVENSYARRYVHIRDILEAYFRRRH